MYNLTKNNYHLKPKNSTIYTPPEVSQFIFELLKDKVDDRKGLVLDPCCGKGSLLEPWQSNSPWIRRETYGIDIDPESSFLDLQTDFLKISKKDFNLKPDLVLCNPPFNGYKNQLGSEVWLDKIIELFGKEIPLVLFAPMGFRLNGKKNGRRWTKFTNDKYPAISSIISLPRDIFPNTEFHSEILIFNIKGLQPHYFYQPNYEPTRK